MYQFKKINDDEYCLISDNKEFPFKRTVDIAKEMQSIDMITTVKVAEFLAERGETYDNTKLRVERIEGNNTIIDESNLRMIEKKAKDIATTEVLNKVYKRLFNKSIAEMLKELDITNVGNYFLNKLSSGQDIFKLIIEKPKIKSIKNPDPTNIKDEKENIKDCSK